LHTIDEFIECSSSLTPKPNMRTLDQTTSFRLAIASFELVGLPSLLDGIGSWRASRRSSGPSWSLQRRRS